MGAAETLHSAAHIDYQKLLQNRDAGCKCQNHGCRNQGVFSHGLPTLASE